MNNKYRQELIAEMRRIAERRGINDVFTTFLEVAATSIAAEMDSFHAAERQERYAAIAASLPPMELASYAHMMVLLGLAIQQSKDEPCDILGGIYHELKLNNEWKGQFFTPDSVCRMMAQITLQDVLDKEPPITINEPACGSGAMILGAIWAMQQRNFDFHAHSYFVAQDLDIRCVWMAYIQLALYGVPAVVIHSNSLSCEEWSKWYTPYAFPVLLDLCRLEEAS